MAMAWSHAFVASRLLWTIAASLGGGGGGRLCPWMPGPVSVSAASGADHSDEVSLLQHSVADHHRHSRRGALEVAAKAAAADRSAAPSLLQRQGGPTWPQPGDPLYQMTPEHRLQVQAFKAAVAAQDVEAINNTVAAMALVPVKLDIEEGVYPLIFSVLHDYQDDKYQYVQQMAWRGLSDQSGTELGAPLIANCGGPSQGIEYMVHQMQAHPEPYYGLCSDHVTVKYEILACMVGLLRNDRDNVWGPAAVHAGLLDQILYTMRAEPDLIASQATACRVMGEVLQRNPHYVPALQAKGALELVESSMERFRDGDDTPFHFGFTLGSFYNVTSACAYPRSLLLGEDPATAQAKFDADRAQCQRMADGV